MKSANVPAPDAPPPAVVPGIQAFGTALYEQLAGAGGNLFFAPVGISLALAMTAAGARGETAAEMARALHFPDLEPQQLHAAFGALAAALREAPGVELAVAQALFGQRGDDFLPDFLALLDAVYGAGLQEVDFVQPDAARAVELPRFRIEATFELNDALQGLGLRTAFDFDAGDFSGMTGRDELHLSAVLHKAFIEVNEEGTEAAAATAAVMAARGLPSASQHFHADHPFLFLLRDRRTRCVLFLGRLVDPRGGTPAPDPDEAWRRK